MIVVDTQAFVHNPTMVELRRIVLARSVNIRRGVIRTDKRVQDVASDTQIIHAIINTWRFAHEDNRRNLEYLCIVPNL